MKNNSFIEFIYKNMETENNEAQNNNNVSVETFVCYDCHKTYNKDTDTIHYYGDETICQNCCDDNYVLCESCEDLTHKDNAIWTNSDYYICEGCYEDDYFTCEDCGNVLHNDHYSEDGFCDSCINDHSENTDRFNRRYDKTDLLVEAGKRAYSCEIECYYNDIDDLEKVSKEITPQIGITDDGSLDDNGKEFITPKLSGVIGEKTLRKLCKELNANNFYVNRTCGLHIHLDCSDYKTDNGELNIDKVKKLFLFYLAFEPVIYSYLPLSRRKNTYCLPLNSFFHEKEINEAQELNRLEQIWYREQDFDRIKDRKSEKYDSTRYAGINFHSLFSNGHLEIRYHTGTIDYRKIKNWIDLHVAILDYIRNDNYAWAEIGEVKFLSQLQDKQARLFKLLNLPKTIQKYLISRQKKFKTPAEVEDKETEANDNY